MNKCAFGQYSYYFCPSMRLELSYVWFLILILSSVLLISSYFYFTSFVYIIPKHIFLSYQAWNSFLYSFSASFSSIFKNVHGLFTLILSKWHYGQFILVNVSVDCTYSKNFENNLLYFY